MATSRILPVGTEKNLATGHTPVIWADISNTGEWGITQAQAHGQLLIYTNLVISELDCRLPSEKAGLAVLLYNPRSTLLMVIGNYDSGSCENVYIDGIALEAGKNWAASSGNESILLICDGTNWNAAWHTGVWSAIG